MLLFPDALDAPRPEPDRPGALAVRLGPTALLLAHGRHADEAGEVLRLTWKIELPSLLPGAADASYAAPDSGATVNAGDIPIPEEALARGGRLTARDLVRAIQEAAGAAARARLGALLAEAARIAPGARQARIIPHADGVVLHIHEPEGWPMLPDDVLGGPAEGRALARLRVLQEGEFRRLDAVVLPLPQSAHERLAWQGAPISR